MRIFEDFLDDIDMSIEKDNVKSLVDESDIVPEWDNADYYDYLFCIPIDIQDRKNLNAIKKYIEKYDTILENSKYITEHSNIVVLTDIEEYLKYKKYKQNKQNIRFIASGNKYLLFDAVSAVKVNFKSMKDIMKFCTKLVGLMNGMQKDLMFCSLDVIEPNGNRWDIREEPSFQKEGGFITISFKRVMQILGYNVPRSYGQSDISDVRSFFNVGEMFFDIKKVLSDLKALCPEKIDNVIKERSLKIDLSSCIPISLFDSILKAGRKLEIGAYDLYIKENKLNDNYSSIDIEDITNLMYPKHYRLNANTIQKFWSNNPKIIDYKCGIDKSGTVEVVVYIGFCDKNETSFGSIHMMNQAEKDLNIYVSKLNILFGSPINDVKVENIAQKLKKELKDNEYRGIKITDFPKSFEKD